MKIRDRDYLDFNSTSPLADSVIRYLESGDFYFANPSSIHQSGKLAKRILRNSKEFILNYFNLAETEFDLFFHSGATEGINIVLQGWEKSNPDGIVIGGPIDHSCVYNFIKANNENRFLYQIDPNGFIDSNKLENLINQFKNRPILINLTKVNNEIGLVIKNEVYEKLGRFENVFIHSDNAQLIGKIENYQKLSQSIDCSTFSGHKFGALKGTGFTIYKKSFNFRPLFFGGNQQDGLRSGTENILGIKSLTLALKEASEKFNCDQLRLGIELFKKTLKENLGEEIIFINADSDNYNLNTATFIVKRMTSDKTLLGLDLAGIEVSTGSACSSGIVKPNRVLQNLGYDDLFSQSSIRVSFGSNLDENYAKNIAERISQVVRRML